MSWSDYTRAGSGKSMARALMAVLVVGTVSAINIAAWRSGAFSAPMAAAVTGIASTLAGVWWFSKSKWRTDAPASSKGPGAPDQEVPQ